MQDIFEERLQVGYFKHLASSIVQEKHTNKRAIRPFSMPVRPRLDRASDDENNMLDVAYTLLSNTARDIYETRLTLYPESQHVSRDSDAYCNLDRLLEETLLNTAETAKKEAVKKFAVMRQTNLDGG